VHEVVQYYVTTFLQFLVLRSSQPQDLSFKEHVDSTRAALLESRRVGLCTVSSEELRVTAVSGLD